MSDHMVIAAALMAWEEMYHDPQAYLCRFCMNLYNKNYNQTPKFSALSLLTHNQYKKPNKSQDNKSHEPSKPWPKFFE